MNEDLKTYEKWYLKRNHATGRIEMQDGKPVLSEFIRTVRINEQRMRIFNSGWEMSGQMLVEPKVSDDELVTLREKAKELGIKGGHMMKAETLIEKINEASK